MDHNQKESGNSKSCILIEGSKLTDDYNDGIKRFVVTLLDGLIHSEEYLKGAIEIDVKVLDEILPIQEAVNKYLLGHSIQQAPIDKKEELHDVSILLAFKSRLGLFLYRLGIINVIRSFFMGLFYKKSKKQYDLIHFTLPQIMNPWHDSKTHLVTIHDATHLSHKEFHLSENVKNAHSGFRMIKQYLPHIHVISRSTYNAVAEIDERILEKARLIYEGIDHSLFYPEKDELMISDILKTYDLEDNEYLFCLATNEPRKNLANTVKGFLRFKEMYSKDVKLAIGGKPGWKSEAIPSDPSVLYLGYIPDTDLRALYSRAKAFCFVSHFEGFGLPPLEAMSCGTVPIYGDNSAMSEIIGEYGRGVDPSNIEAIALEMKYLVCNDEIRKDMELKALNFSQNFSTKGFITGIISFYNEIIANQNHN